MEKKTLKELRKALLTIGLTGTIISTASCSNTKKSGVVEQFEEIDDYYKYMEVLKPAIYDENGKVLVRISETEKVYHSQYTSLMYDKETHELKGYMIPNQITLILDVNVIGMDKNGEVVPIDTTQTIYENENIKKFKEIADSYDLVKLNLVAEKTKSLKKEYYTVDEIKDMGNKLYKSNSNVKEYVKR